MISLPSPDARPTGEFPALNADGGHLRGLVDPVEVACARALLRSQMFGGPPEPVMLGRFVVVRRLGAGGMGVVYLARDPELEREVAIKLIHCDVTGARDDPEAVTRLLAEARAMARLTHPNVVPVYEVGTVEGAVFIVMEHAPGGSLWTWLRAAPRSVAAILQVFLAAGEGLAAAHRAGIVHRDFKPDNILLGAEGSVRVADFGLAKLAETGAPRGLGPGATASAIGSAVLGTPAYMAPEQHLGRPTDARADQYAFCVALYEALFGRRPWQAVAPEQLVDVVTGRDVTVLPRRPAVPRQVQRALLRGLARDPARRHPTMAPLLAALRPQALRRGSLVVAALAGAASVAGIWHRSIRESPCAAAAQGLAGVWDDAVRDAIAARPEASDPQGATVWSNAAGRLDAYAAAWTTMRVEACEASLVRHEQSATLFDQRMLCLDDARQELAGVGEFLRSADLEGFAEATTLVDDLPRLERCADSEVLLALTARSTAPELRARIEAVQAALTPIRIAIRVGRHRSVQAQLLGLQTKVDALDDLTLAALYWRTRGQLANMRGEFAEEERALGRALEAGGAAHDDEALARTWESLAWTIGVSQARPAEGLQLLRPAELASRNLRGDLGTEMRIELLDTRGSILLFKDDLDGAVEAFSGALALAHAEQWKGDTWPIRGHLAVALSEQSRNSEAVLEQRRALADAEVTLGKEHVRVAYLHYHLAGTLVSANEYEQARPHLDRAEALFTTIYGSEHVIFAAVQELRGSMAERIFDDAAAYAAFARARQIRLRMLPPEHPDHEKSIYQVGVVAHGFGRIDEARTLLYQALAAYERRHGGDHTNVANTLAALGELEFDQGDPAAALRLLHRAVEILDRTQPGVDPRRIDSHIVYADVLLTLRRPAEALADLDFMIAALADGEVNEDRTLWLTFLRARALYGLGRRSEARQIIARVLAASASGQHLNELHEAVEGWLARPR